MTTGTQEHSVGFYWHVHHDILVEWCHSYEERVEAIKTTKDIEEQPLRLRLLQPVRGPLPPAFVKARATFVKAWATREEAEATFVKAGATFVKAGATFVKARATYDKAVATAMPALVALHAQECKDCPWNGNTIFAQQAVSP